MIDIDGSTGVIGAFKKAIFGLQIVSSLLLSKVFPSVVAPPFLFEV